MLTELTPDLDLLPRSFGCNVDMGAYELPTSACIHDIDGSDDECVGFADLTLLLLLWGSCESPCPADFNDKGDVGFSDLTALLMNWGSCPPAQPATGFVGGAPELSEDPSIRAPTGGVDPLLIPTGPDSPDSPMGAQTAGEADGALAPWQAVTWLAAGGADGLLDGTISPAQVAECMDATTPFTALMDLLGE